MKPRNALITVLAVLVPVFPGLAQESRWEKTIQGFEREDLRHPPEKGGILFVGSSSIRFWNTDKDFPGLGIVNRGFGGSETSDVVEFMDRIVLPHAPRVIVMYVGGNDIARGKSAEDVLRDTVAFVERIHEKLPSARIVYLSIKPSLLRWGMMARMRAANALVEAMAREDPLVDYVDVDTPMLGEDGKPRKELFVRDGLHLSAEGYALWNALVRPLLAESGSGG